MYHALAILLTQLTWREASSSSLNVRTRDERTENDLDTHPANTRQPTPRARADGRLAGAYVCQDADFAGICCHFPFGQFALSDDDAIASRANEEVRLCLSRLNRIGAVQLSPHAAIDVYAGDMWMVRTRPGSFAHVPAPHIRPADARRHRGLRGRRRGARASASG